MMKVPMDNASNPSSGERVKRLYNKNVELENRRRRSTQARTPSDLNAWQQIRENFEAMILEDHAFSEQHEIEYALWQLHYKRIEELRACFSAALASASNTSQAGKGSMRPDQITKIRSQFKTFLSDATGFYHDLMLKIRAKYGLPLDDPESQIVQSEDGNKSAEKKKGFISCHRCLIYLGDLARYKGLYGEDDSKGREFAAASSYYMQASSLWPSSGNPHHQLAILASYSGNELVSVYQYFRSLAVDNPFSTARDNLIMAFEKNRQSYSQLLGDGKASSAKAAAIKMTRKGRGKSEGRFSSKDYRTEENSVKEKASNIPEIFKSFCIRFIRLNGILFTRTSLETFGEVFATARCDFLELLSSEPEEEFNIGFGAAESGIVIVRIIAILIFQVHNVYRETENQSYAEILQRPVLLQNAFTSTFEFMGHILERCLQLHDPSTSYLCPGVLVFVEWLACCPDVAAGSEVEEKQAEARSFFWNNCISFLNKILLSEFLSINEDEDESFFSNRNRYDESETGNRLALWEDLELRGFLPLAPAHLILDFSRKHSLESDGGIKEKKVRVQRIIAAGKALANVIRIGEQGIYFDSKLKKFAIGVEPQMSNDDLLASSFEVPVNEHPREMKMNMVGVQPRPQFYMEGEEEDEVIVFKPLVSDKNVNAIAPEMTPNEVLAPVSNACNGAMKSFVESVPAPHMQNAFDTSFRPPSSLASIAPQQHPEPIQPSRSKWLLEQQTSISNGLNKLSFVDTGIAFKPELQEQLGVLQPTGFSLPYSQCANLNPGSIYSGQIPEIPSKFDAIMYSGANFDRVPVNKSSAFPSNSTRNPVSRPIRHVGPPPGFHPVPPKIVDEPLLVGNMKNDNLQMDDYSWLDGYQLPSSTQGTIFNNTINHSEQKLNHATWSNNSTGTFSFPFPGKQVLGLQVQTENQYNWQDHQFPDNLKQFQEQHQQVQKGNQRSIPLPDQYQGQSLWEGRYFV